MNDPVEAKKTPASSVFSMAVVALAIVWFFTPFLPRVIKVVVPFPAFEDLTYIEGTFDYEGEWPEIRTPRYFVVNNSGRHEFRCGYLGARQPCFYKANAIKGQAIKIWTSYLYGLIQHEVVFPPGVRPYPLDRAVRSYADTRDVYLDPRYVQAKDFNPLSPLLLSLLLGWLVVREKWRRQTAETNSQTNTRKD
jgi:hypothetical protein